MVNRYVRTLIAVAVTVTVVVTGDWYMRVQRIRAIEAFRQSCSYESVAISVDRVAGIPISDQERVSVVTTPDVVCYVWETLAEAELVSEKEAGIYDINVDVMLQGDTISAANFFVDFGSNRVVGFLQTSGQELPIAFNDNDGLINELIVHYGIPVNLIPRY